MREDRAVRDDGSTLIVPRDKLKLTTDSYPSIFPNQPAYLSSEPPLKKKTPSERAHELIQRDEENFLEWCSNDSIKSFEDFKIGFPLRVGKEWCHSEQEDFIVFYKINLCNVPKITVSIKIHRDLTVTIWHGLILLNSKSFESILEKENKCDKWTKFDCLLNLLNCYDENDMPVKDKLNYAVQILAEHKMKIENDEGKSVFFIDIIMEQISLLMTKKYVYSSNYILFAAKLYFSYPSAYIFIRNSKCLILPHPVYLKKLSGPLNSNSNLNNSSCLSISSNIFINNYVKERNDKIKTKSSKRKLSTLAI